MDVEVFEVDTKEAVKSISDLKQELKEARKDFENAAVGSEEYDEALTKVTALQVELKDAVNASSLSLDEATQKIDTANMSYNQMQATMTDLIKAYKETNDEVARTQIGENIAKINDQLKGLDASIGNYQRNVGNYGSVMQAFSAKFPALSQGLSKMSGGLKLATASTKGFGLALKAAGIGVILTVVQALIDAFKWLAEKINISEEAMAGLKSVMDILQVPMNAISELIDGLVKKFVALVKSILETVSELEWLPDVMRNGAKAALEQMEATEALAKSERDLKDITLEVNEAMNKRDKLMIIAKDNSKDAKERQEALNKATEVYNTALEHELELRKKHLELMEKEAREAPNDAKANDELRAAKQAVLDVEKKLIEAQKEYINVSNQIDSSTNSIKKHTNIINELYTEDQKYYIRSVQEKIKIAKQNEQLARGLAEIAARSYDISNYDQVQQEYLESARQHFQEYIQYSAEALREEYTQNVIAIQEALKDNKIHDYTAVSLLENQKQILKQNFIQLSAYLGETSNKMLFDSDKIITEITNRFDDIPKQLESIISDERTEIGTSIATIGEAIADPNLLMTLNEEAKEITTVYKQLIKDYDEAINTSEDTMEKVGQQAQLMLDTIEDLSERIIDESNNITNLKGLLDNTIDEAEKRRIQSQIDYYKVSIESMEDEQVALDLHYNELINQEVALGAQRLQIEQKFHQQEELLEKKAAQNSLKVNQSRIAGLTSQYTNAAANVTDLIATVNDESEKAFNVNKGMQIANATMQTYQSATGAYSSLSGIPIVGPALGAAAAAAAIAAGLKNVAEIAKTKFDSSGETATTSATPTTVSGYMEDMASGNTSVSTTTVVSPSSTTDTQQTAQVSKVYITKSDIQDAIKSDVTQYSL